MIDAIEPGKPVFMLSGQGSQAPGMGADLLDVPEVRESFVCASDAFGFDVGRLVTEGSPEELRGTVCAQASILAVSIGIARALAARGIEPAAVLGFSLGQVGALAVSGMLSLEETLAFAAHRARIMERSAEMYPGGMCALLGADEQTAREVCESCAEGDVLVPANFNCPGQIVVSGSHDAIARVQEAWASRKKRSVILATEGAFHSPLMREATEELATYLSEVRFRESRVPLICNVDAEPLSAADAPDHLVRHLTQPVRFCESVSSLVQAGAADFVETGFGGVLVGFIRRIDKNVARTLVHDRESFEAACEHYVHRATDDEAGLRHDQAKE